MAKPSNDKRQLTRIAQLDGEALLVSSVGYEEFEKKLGIWLAGVSLLGSRYDVLGYRGKREGGDLRQQTLQTRLGQRISYFLTQKLNAIAQDTGNAFKEQRDIDTLLHVNGELGTESVQLRVSQLGNAWLRCAQTRKSLNKDSSEVAAAAKEAFLNDVKKDSYPVILSLLGGAERIEIEKLYHEIFDSGFSSLKSGQVPAWRVVVYCDQTLEAAKRAGMDRKDAAGQIMGALLAGSDELSKTGNREADIMACGRAYNRMREIWEKPSGPSGGGGKSQVQKLNALKEARAGAGWTL